MKLAHRGTSGPLPTSSYDLVDAAGNVIGYAQLRHLPSHSADLPATAGNHVFYSIAPAHRGKGHGKALLALVLAEARKIGLRVVRLTVDDDNVASRRVIEGAGAVLVGTFGRIQLYEIAL